MNKSLVNIALTLSIITTISACGPAPTSIANLAGDAISSSSSALTGSSNSAQAKRKTATPAAAASPAAPADSKVRTETNDGDVDAEEAPEPAPSAAPTTAPSPAASATPAPQASASASPTEPEPTPSPTPTPEPTATPEPEFKTDFFFFSYDDSASTAGVELTKNALQNNFAPRTSWARPWEFLNFESFAKNNQEDQGLFKVSMGLWKHADVENPSTENYELGVHVSAPSITKEERKNAVITLVVDASGSMDSPSPLAAADGRAPSLMDLAKHGMEAMANSLKEGDIINIVDFSNDARKIVDGLNYSEATKNTYLQAVQGLNTRGGTNLNAGVDVAYELAQKHYDANKINRVVMLTDAFANTGEVDPTKISKHTEINNLEGILFSGLGFGQDFNEAFLNELTEAGRGGYFSVVTTKDAERAFQERFMALVNVAAQGVQFRLDYPASLKRLLSAAEESSKVQSEVQPTNFSFNTSQYFWEQFGLDGETNINDQSFTLSIFYTDPKTREKKTVEVKKTVSEMLGQDISNIKDAHMITLLTLLIKSDVTEERAKKEVNELLGDHSSALATEYRKYFETFFSFKK